MACWRIVSELSSTDFGEIVSCTRGAVTISYQVAGPEDGTPLLLVAGLGAQMITWHAELCGALAARGFAVARFDNRDVGLSTHLEGPTPGRVATVLRPRAVARYRLEDMAADAVSVLDALGWTRAFVMGFSLGGAIAQVVAITAPERVAGLVSVMSTPSLRVGRGRLRALLALVRGPVASSAAAEDRLVELYRTIGSPGFALDETWLRAIAACEYARSYDPAGVRRQLAAMMVGGDRRSALGTVRAPTLVLHGEEDPVFRPAAARATAAAVPGARLVLLAGMGHDLPRALWPTVVDEVAALADLAPA
jgi:pimeloyl-ACP methyl ester carboxylesterase